MPIAPLPQSTVRAIGSTSVLSDAGSVVKELLDNALDANASSVSIEISQNTVDLIQVKDNGHGIPPEDHSFVCKRSFTSKIQTLDDLRNVGGTSLGFRGEALASACEMSGGLAVTTRVESQVVGATLKYSRTGELTSSERASHPVGTTVRVTDFLKHIPVRRQKAIKSASKTINRIKKFLQAYAVAQPSRRISFKVIKSKNENHNWTYAPKLNTTLREAALLVAGPEVAAHCTEIAWPHQDTDQDESESTFAENHTTVNYELISFLPKADSDFSKVSSGGQYISVDGRPVSTSRGTFRDIIKVFKSYIRSAAKTRGNSTSLSDPFLCLHIRCPRGSYDVNVEPAKDDVLFTDSGALISLLEALFKRIYGELDDSGKSDVPVSMVNYTSNNSTSIREPVMAESADNYYRKIMPATSQVLSIPAGRRQSSIYQPPMNENRSTLRVETPMRSGEIDIRNPWAIARLNSSVRSGDNAGKNRGRLSHLLTPSRTQNALESPEPENVNSRYSGSPPLPSPSNSESASSSSESRRSSLSVPHSHYSPDRTAYTKSARDLAKERYGNGALDTWFQKITQSSMQQPAIDDSADREARDLITEEQASDRFANERRQSQVGSQISGDLTGELSGTAADTQASSVDRTVIPRLSGRDRLLEEIEGAEPSESISGRRPEFPVLERWSSRLHQSSAPESSSETEMALDFERRKKAAIQSRRLQTKVVLGSMASRKDDPPSSSPHQNRYLAARAALASPAINSDTETPINACPPTDATGTSPIDHDDPRAYFIRHRDHLRQDNFSKTGLKIRRMHTSKLPLERIPDGLELHDVALKLTINTKHLSSSFARAFDTDLYCQSGESFEAFSAADTENLELWQAQLQDLVKERYRAREADGEPDICFDLSTIEVQTGDNID